MNAVGTYTTDTRELDGPPYRKPASSSRIADAAVAEAGDLTWRSATCTAERIDADLQELVHGASVGGHHTVFKSVGLAIEDLALAGAGSWAR